jgi:hypothetical protein
MDKNFKYKDEEDRSYGLTGMAVSIVVWEAENLLGSVDLDAPSGEGMMMTPEFYFAGNPNLSAKAAWNSMLEHFQLSTAMMVANVMCRQYVNSGTGISTDLRRRMLDYAIEEGREACSLDDDETLRLFDKCYNYCQRVFQHPGVQQLVRQFAEALRSRRSLTRAEVAEQLRALNRM